MGACVSSRSSTSSAHAGRTGKYELSTPDLSQFELRRVIGKGAFGKVKTVVHRRTGNKYALKYISKSSCIERQAVTNVVRERKILESLDHPLVCKLRYAFQDSENLYLIFDLMSGGDLRFHMLRKTFTESTIRHWISEIAAACAYCHRRGIVHRDIKPENVLLTQGGHIKLVDFNIATQIRKGVLPHSRTGSLFYMAPEVLSGRSYDFAVDFWSLGVVMYECVYNRRPFFAKTNTEVGRLTRESEPTFPSTDPSVSPDCKEAMKRMLKKDPNRRPRTLDALRKLAFFCTVDWEATNAGQAAPVYVPGDGQNFDASLELEEILLHDNLLDTKSRRPRSQKKKLTDPTRVDEMHELIENHFTDYDHTVHVTTVQWPLGLNSTLNASASSLALPVTRSDMEDSGYIDLDDKVAAELEEEKVQPLTETKKSTGLFGGKQKKPTVLPNGVLSMRPGGRVEV